MFEGHSRGGGPDSAVQMGDQLIPYGQDSHRVPVPHDCLVDFGPHRTSARVQASPKEGPQAEAPYTGHESQLLALFTS